MISEFKIPENKININYIGIELQKGKHLNKDNNSRQYKKFVFGYSGRIHKEKGIIILLEAFKELIHEESNVSLILQGDGPGSDVVISYITKHKELEDYVIFNNFWSDDLKFFFQSINMLVLPSFSEGTPRIILESFNHAIPCIASNVGGVSEILENEVTGYLVPPGNVKKLYEKLKHAIHHKEEIYKLCQNAYKYVHKYHDVRNEIRNIEDIYSATTEKLK
jgi:glycosyltransferase involved in cell wall biosynthesis